MQALVVGFGVSGRSAKAFLEKKGAKVWVHDDNPEKVPKQKPFPNSFDLVVLSPGVASCSFQGKEIIGEAELACRYLQNTCIGITGTNGKTTVSEMIAHVLKFCGQRVHLLGNGGVPITSAVDEISPKDLVVLELSSFQLETLLAKVLDVALLLNITEDHLDRYPDFASYAHAKASIQNCLKAGGALFSHPNCTQYLKAGFACFLKAADHNQENENAAFAACHHLGVTQELFFEALKTFQKPPHRLEFVKAVDGVSFYDDSKGTNVDAVIRAVQSLEGKIALIAGGIDKGSDFSAWVEPFRKKVSHLFVIGKAAEKIEKQLSPYLPVKQCESLEVAVKQAKKIAKPGEHVVLSPGCASFDMFRSYADRGDQFKKIVRAINHEST